MTGLRPIEVCNLKWDSIDLAKALWRSERPCESICLPVVGLIISVAISLIGRGIAVRALTILRCASLGTNGLAPRGLRIRRIGLFFLSAKEGMTNSDHSSVATAS